MIKPSSEEIRKLRSYAEADNRKFIRFESFEYALANFSAFVPSQIVIVNIGLGGLQARSRKELPIGEICELAIASIDLPKIKIPVEVRYCQKLKDSELYSIGMKFKPRTHEERLAIAKYVHDVFQRQCDLLCL